MKPASEEAIRWLGLALEGAGTGETRARLLEGLGIHILMLGDLAAAHQALAVHSIGSVSQPAPALVAGRGGL